MPSRLRLRRGHPEWGRDPLDALVLVQEPTFPGCLIRSRGGGSRGLPAAAARAGEQARL